MEATSSGNSNNDSTKRRLLYIDWDILPAKLAYLFKLTLEDKRHFSILFYMAVGLNLEEASQINGLQYIGGLIGAPLIGYIADRTRSYKLIAVLCCILTVITNCIQPFLSLTYRAPYMNTCPQSHRTSKIIFSTEAYNDSRRHIMFYLLLIFSTLSSAFEISGFSFVDSGVLQRMRTRNDAQFGWQRMFGAFGMCIGALSNSLAIQYFPKTHITCYSGIFITYGVFGVLLIISCFYLFKNTQIDELETPSNEVTSVLITTLKRPDLLFFLLCVLFNGIIQANWYSFTYSYVKQKNAPTMLFSLTMSIASLSALISYRYANTIIDWLGGPLQGITICWFFMAIRCFTTGMIQSPYFLIFPELIAGPSYSLFLVASIEYIRRESPTPVLTSLCGIMNSLFNPFSYLIANVLGGRLFHKYGGKALFIYSAFLCLIWGFIMLLYIYVKNLLKKREISENVNFD